MQCPFCYSFLKKEIFEFHVSFFCDNEDCMMSGEMPRFKDSYEIDFPLSQEYLTNREFCIDEYYYVKIDFKLRQTILYKFQIVLISDAITIEKVIDFDLKDLDSVRKKIKIITTFS